MSRKRWLLLLSFIIWFGFIATVLISAINKNGVTTKEVKQVDILVYKDSDNKITQLNELSTLPFIQYNVSGYAGALDASGASYWFYLPKEAILNGFDSLPNIIYLEIAKPQLDAFTFYTMDETGSVIDEGKMGRDLPFEERQVDHRNYIIKVEALESFSGIYFNVKTDSYLQFPLYVYEDSELFAHLTKDMVMNGLFYGAMIIMLLFNVILGITIKDRRYLFFSIFIIANTMLQGVWDGFSYQYIWPSNGYLDLIANPMMINLLCLSLLVFSKSLFRLNKASKKYDVPYHSIIIWMGCSLLLTPFLIYKASVYMSMFSVLLSVAYILSLLIRKHLHTKAEILYLIAWQMFFAANLLSLVAGFNWIEYTTLVQYAPKFAVVLLIAFFSLALTDKINTIEYQKQLSTERLRFLRSLDEMHVQLSSSLNLEMAMNHLFDVFMRLFDFKQGVVLITDDWHKACEVYTTMGSGGVCIPFDQEGYDEIVSEIKNNPEALAQDRERIERLVGVVLPYAMTVPLIHNNKVIGIVLLFATKPIELPRDTKDMILNYAKQIAITIDNMILLERVAEQARFDELTNVYNRRYFFEKALKKGFVGLNALMIIDIDDFKKVNDTYGHLVGDKTLVSVATRLMGLMDDKSLLGRYGGEEFVVFISDTKEEEVYALADRILKVFNQVPELVYSKGQKEALRITVSIGIAFDDDTQNIYDMMDRADKALYEAKRYGKNQKVVYN